MTEVSIWYAVSMAKLQQKTVQYATGPAHTPDGIQLVRLPNKTEKNMCKSQIVRSQSGTISFPVLGVAIILCLRRYAHLDKLVTRHCGGLHPSSISLERAQEATVDFRRKATTATDGL